MKPKDRIQEINLEIRKLLKLNSNPKILKPLQAELKELLIKKRLPPTLFKIISDTENLKKLKSKKSNPVDFQKARARKSANEFTDSIKTGSLYKELRPKKEKKN